MAKVSETEKILWALQNTRDLLVLDESHKTRSKKYHRFHVTYVDGRTLTVWVGKAGAVRSGPTVQDSIALPALKQWLIRFYDSTHRE